MRKEYFNLLSEFHRDFVLTGLGNVVSNLVGVFVFFSGDLARGGIQHLALDDLLTSAARSSDIGRCR